MKQNEKQNKLKIRNSIEVYELYSGGFNSWACPPEITATNIRIRKDKIVANIKIRYIEEGKTEMFADCEYSPSSLQTLQQVGAGGCGDKHEDTGSIRQRPSGDLVRVCNRCGQDYGEVLRDEQ
ncbi:MAG: hypothetical protein Q8O88_00735 [bacterium]|nr:hypothetical protein [bacterium]